MKGNHGVIKDICLNTNKHYSGRDVSWRTVLPYKSWEQCLNMLKIVVLNGYVVIKYENYLIH